jgi:spore coat polysaccharide biosynthesis predicted glycosyltransferase SpsG
MSINKNNKKKEIIFVVEGGTKIGMGHLVQALALADLMNDRADVSFISKSDEIVINKIENAGYNVLKLNSDNEIIAEIEVKRPDIVIIDNINVSEDMARKIKENSDAKLVIFTNLSDANKYADIAVVPGIGHELKDKLFADITTTPIYFYGPKYWIMRSEFSYYHNKKKNIPREVQKILCIFGGSDPANLTTVVIEELLKLSKEYKVKIVLGARFAHENALNEVLEKYQNSKISISIEKDIENVAEEMYFTDLTLTSPGLSAFESLYVGTPIIVFPQNDMQKIEFQGIIEMLEMSEITKLNDYVINSKFTYPNQESIASMHSGEGEKEVIQAIID